MSSTLLIIQTLNGLQLGILLFLIAAGLTLVFGVMDFINLAHGVQYMLGAYLAAMFVAWTGSSFSPWSRRSPSGCCSKCWSCVTSTTATISNRCSRHSA
jgi:branched-subunit amino acid ABC-type transport system permease component